ncbi:MAG TPA: DUF2189 domain-containing protein [Thermohalobaculum sp.]|nr:DUF2189 domain-containing protein [Thermohalobaculum sp.]
MVSIPKTVPPLPRKSPYARALPPEAALGWLKAGWSDLRTQPGPSLVYGLLVFVISLAVIGGLYALALDFILFPALAGFMVVGPLVAIGLYEKSRRLEAGEPVGLRAMILVQPRSGGQVLFIGVLLALLTLLWNRAAVLIYALFFGLRPFPGIDEVVPLLFTTPTGWAILIVGTAVGGLFAAFSLAISVFAVPMMLAQRLDALTAMGTSMVMVWNNLPVMIAWGAVVVGLFGASVLTGLVGLIVVFPLLGHATWHAWQAMHREADA